MYGYHDHAADSGWAPWLLMGLMMLVFLAVVAWGVFLVWRSTSHPHAAHADPRSDARQAPRDILAERLARGEIDAAEYRERLDALKPPG